MRDGFRRAFRLDRRSPADAGASVDEELAFHLQEAEQELVEAGWLAEDARREALRRFGDLEGTRAFCRAVQSRRGRGERRAMTIDELRSDVRYALRSMRKSPGYTTLVVATLAFGVAANTTIFSAMRPYLLRPLPYGEPDELVQVNQVNPVTGWDMDRFSYPQVLDWKERTHAFVALGAYSYGVGNLTGPQGPEQVQFGHVTAGLFEDVLRVEPVLGRGFRPEEGRPGADPVVVLSDALWRRRYGADPGILGAPIALDGVQRTVVGVMPPAFVFPFGSARLWVPVTEDAGADRGRTSLQIVGRLDPGWTPARARAELVGVQTELAARYPEADGRMSGVTVKPLREALNFVWDVLAISFPILLGAVALVLLIACLNVASLTLARASGRAREVAVRAAMGAPRGRIVRQLLTESLVLALLGGALGVLLSYWTTGLLDPVLPEDLYRVGHIEIDGAVLAFSLLVTLATPVAFGLWPALSASRAGVGEALSEASKGSAGVRASRTRRALVVAQVGLAVVLTTGAALMVRSLVAVQHVDLGFDADRVVTAEVTLPVDEYRGAAERIAWVDRAIAALARTPGVTSAAAVAWLPLNHELFTWQVAPPEDGGRHHRRVAARDRKRRDDRVLRDHGRAAPRGAAVRRGGRTRRRAGRDPRAEPRPPPVARRERDRSHAPGGRGRGDRRIPGGGRRGRRPCRGPVDGGPRAGDLSPDRTGGRPALVPPGARRRRPGSPGPRGARCGAHGRPRLARQRATDDRGGA